MTTTKIIPDDQYKYRFQTWTWDTFYHTDYYNYQGALKVEAELNAEGKVFEVERATENFIESLPEVPKI